MRQPGCYCSDILCTVRAFYIYYPWMLMIATSQDRRPFFEEDRIVEEKIYLNSVMSLTYVGMT